MIGDVDLIGAAFCAVLEMIIEKYIPIPMLRTPAGLRGLDPDGILVGRLETQSLNTGPTGCNLSDPWYHDNALRLLPGVVRLSKTL